MVIEKRMVVHCKKDPYDVYIGRPSKWGNPFTVGKDGTREEVIIKYRKWLDEPEQEELFDSISELCGKVLGCWCSPKACHGDVLHELAQCDFDTNCPRCGCIVGIILNWEGGECPVCGNEYWQEERCTEDYSDCWSEIEWDKVNRMNDEELKTRGHCGYCYDGEPSERNPDDPDSECCDNPING